MTYPLNIPTTPTVRRLTVSDVPCVAIDLKDDQGGTYEVILQADDWAAARDLTPAWRIATEYEKPRVISKAPAASLHHQWTYRGAYLRLEHFLMKPPYGHTVRFLDGSTLNLIRSNLVVRPKGARTIEAPPVEREPTLKELRTEALATAILEKRDWRAAIEAATEAHKARAKAKAAATRAAKKAASEAREAA
jgi:hypothetical protein